MGGAILNPDILYISTSLLWSCSACCCTAAAVRRFIWSFHIRPYKTDSNPLTSAEWSQLDKRGEVCACVCPPRSNTGDSLIWLWVICSDDKSGHSQWMLHQPGRYSSAVQEPHIAHASSHCFGVCISCTAGYLLQSHNHQMWLCWKTWSRCKGSEEIQVSLWSFRGNKTVMFIFSNTHQNVFTQGLLISEFLLLLA